MGKISAKNCDGVDKHLVIIAVKHPCFIMIVIVSEILDLFLTCRITYLHRY